MPYFVKPHADKRIVCDEKSEYKGVCDNKLIMTDPDFLKLLAHALSRVRKDKYALMTHITKCFLQIKFREAQGDLCRLLWLENNDVYKGKLVSFRICVHFWGIKSSSYITYLAIKKKTRTKFLQSQ